MSVFYLGQIFYLKTIQLKYFQNFLTFVGRHESWKQRTEKRVKEREADEAEEDGEKYVGTAKGGQPFKRSGPMQLATRDIKIKIAVRIY